MGLQSLKNEKEMKRIYLLPVLIVLVFTLGLSACADDADTRPAGNKAGEGPVVVPFTDPDEGCLGGTSDTTCIEISV